MSTEMPPHSIRGLASSDLNYELFALVAFVLLLLLVAAYFIVVRRKGKSVAASKPLPIDPVKDAIEQVRSKFPGPDFGPSEQQHFFYHLSFRLRQLIEHTTKIPAAEATLRELKPMLAEKLPFGEDDRRAVIEFLERADQIKYAGTQSDRGEAEHAREKVLQWMLQLTRTP